MDRKRFCKCGCGQEIKWKPYHKYYTPKYIFGHSNKGKKFTFTKKHKENIGKTGKGRVPWNKGKKGLQKHSIKTKEKISEKLTGRLHLKKQKRK